MLIIIIVMAHTSLDLFQCITEYGTTHATATTITAATPGTVINRTPSITALCFGCDSRFSRRVDNCDSGSCCVSATRIGSTTGTQSAEFGERQPQLVFELVQRRHCSPGLI